MLFRDYMHRCMCKLTTKAEQIGHFKSALFFSGSLRFISKLHDYFPKDCFEQRITTKKHESHVLVTCRDVIKRYNSIHTCTASPGCFSQLVYTSCKPTVMSTVVLRMTSDVTHEGYRTKMIDTSLIEKCS